MKKLTKRDFRKLIKEEIKKIKLKESFGDMAEFRVGAERNNDSEKIQLMIHNNRIVASKKVPLGDKLYGQLFDYIEKKLR